jgi:two-component system, OmpR family, response regulator
MATILLVDDDKTLSPLVKEFLESREYECTLHHNGFDAIDDFKKNEYKLCVLDIKMPIKSGYDIAREIQQINPDVPFLFLSGQLSKEDRIKGLELGADDYITKPFSMQELYLRIKAILKRTEKYERSKNIQKIFQIGKYSFNTETRELSVNGKISILSGIESKLLELFCTSENGIIHREQALKSIWADENAFRERSLNVYVSKLRSFFKEDSNISILNIHGSGYKMIAK